MPSFGDHSFPFPCHITDSSIGACADMSGCRGPLLIFSSISPFLTENQVTSLALSVSLTQSTGRVLIYSSFSKSVAPLTNAMSTIYGRNTWGISTPKQTTQYADLVSSSDSYCEVVGVCLWL